MTKVVHINTQMNNTSNSDSEQDCLSITDEKINTKSEDFVESPMSFSDCTKDACAGALTDSLAYGASTKIFYISAFVSVIWLLVASLTTGIIHFEPVFEPFEEGNYSLPLYLLTYLSLNDSIGQTDIPLILGIVVAPISLLWVLAFSIWRGQQLQQTSQIVAKIAMHLAKPENTTQDTLTVINNSTKNTREEINSISEKLEKTLSRASELETLVRGEVLFIERSCQDNEARVKKLIDVLVTQYKAVVEHTGRLHETLSEVDTSIAQRIEKVGNNVCAALEGETSKFTKEVEDKGAEIGDTISKSMGAISNEMGRQKELVVNDLTRVKNDVIDAMNETFENSILNLAEAIRLHSERFIVESNTSKEAMLHEVAARTSSVLNKINESEHLLTDSFATFSATINDNLLETGTSIADKIKICGLEANDSIRNNVSEVLQLMSSTGQEIVAAIMKQNVDVVDSVHTIEESLNRDMSLRYAEVVENFQTTSMNLTEKIEKAGSGLLDSLNDIVIGIGSTIDTKGSLLKEVFSSTNTKLHGEVTAHSSMLLDKLNKISNRLIEALDSKSSYICENISSSVSTISDALDKHKESLAGPPKHIEKLSLRKKVGIQGLTAAYPQPNMIGKDAVQKKDFTNQQVLDKINALEALVSVIAQKTESISNVMEKGIVKLGKSEDDGSHQLTALSGKKHDYVGNITTADTQANGTYTISTDSNTQEHFIGAEKHSFAVTANHFEQIINVNLNQLSDTISGKITDFGQLAEKHTRDIAKAMDNNSKSFQEALWNHNEQLSQLISCKSNDMDVSLRNQTVDLSVEVNKLGLEVSHLLDANTKNVGRIITDKLERVIEISDDHSTELDGMLQDREAKVVLDKQVEKLDTLNLEIADAITNLNRRFNEIKEYSDDLGSRLSSLIAIIAPHEPSTSDMGDVLNKDTKDITIVSHVASKLQQCAEAAMTPFTERLRLGLDSIMREVGKFENRFFNHVSSSNLDVLARIAHIDSSLAVLKNEFFSTVNDKNDLVSEVHGANNLVIQAITQSNEQLAIKLGEEWPGQIARELEKSFLNHLSTSNIDLLNNVNNRIITTVENSLSDLKDTVNKATEKVDDTLSKTIRSAQTDNKDLITELRGSNEIIIQEIAKHNKQLAISLSDFSHCSENDTQKILLGTREFYQKLVDDVRVSSEAIKAQISTLELNRNRISATQLDTIHSIESKISSIPDTINHAVASSVERCSSHLWDLSEATQSRAIKSEGMLENMCHAITAKEKNDNDILSAFGSFEEQLSGLPESIGGTISQKLDEITVSIQADITKHLDVLAARLTRNIEEKSLELHELEKKGETPWKSAQINISRPLKLESIEPTYNNITLPKETDLASTSINGIHNEPNLSPAGTEAGISLIKELQRKSTAYTIPFAAQNKPSDSSSFVQHMSFARSTPSSEVESTVSTDSHPATAGANDKKPEPPSKLQDFFHRIIEAIDDSVFINTWKRYHAGERNVFNEQIYTPIGLKLVKEIRGKCARDTIFRNEIDRFIADFNLSLRNSSEKGATNKQLKPPSSKVKIFTCLAQIRGQLK